MDFLAVNYKQSSPPAFSAMLALAAVHEEKSELSDDDFPMSKLQLIKDKLRQERQRHQDRRQQLANPDVMQRAKDEKQLEELSGQLEALKALLAHAEEKYAKSEQKCSRQAAEIEQLNNDMSEIEEQLNRSYNETLDQMMKIIKDLQDHQSCRESELQRIVLATKHEKAVIVAQLQHHQAELAAVSQQEKQAQSAVADLSFRLCESNRVSKFLQDAASKSYHELQVHTSKIKELKMEIQTLEARLQQQADEHLARLEAHDTKMKEMVDQIHVWESRLSVSNKVAEFLKNSLSRTEDEKRAALKKATNAHAQLEELKGHLQERDCSMAELEFKLTESTRISTFVQQRLASTVDEKDRYAAKVNELETKLANLERQLNDKVNELCDKDFELVGTKRTLHFAQSILEKTRQDKNEMENILEAKIAEKDFRLCEMNRVMTFIAKTLEKTRQDKDELERTMSAEIAVLEFRLHEANRVARFLQDNSSRVGHEKLACDDKITELETQLTSLKTQLTLKEMELENQKQDYLKNIQEFESKVSDGETRHAFTSTVVECLKAELGRTEEQNLATIQGLKQKISDLELRHSVTTSIVECLQQDLTESQVEGRELVTKVKNVEVEFASVQNLLDEANERLFQSEYELVGTKRVLAFVQNSLNTRKEVTDARENHLEGQIAEKTFLLTESSRIIKFLQATLSKKEESSQERENILQESNASLDFRLKEATRVNQFLQEIILQLENEKTVRENKMTEMELQVSSLTAELADKNAEVQCQNAASREQALKLKELRREIASLESHSSLTNKAAEVMQKKLSSVKQEKLAGDAKLEECSAEMVLLKSQLKKAVDTIHEQEFALTGTKRVLRFVESVMRKLQDDSKTKEQTKQTALYGEDEKAGDPDSRVKQPNRVVKFLKGTIRAESPQRNQKAVLSLRARVQEQEEALKIKEKECSDQAEMIQNMNYRIADLESRIFFT